MTGARAAAGLRTPGAYATVSAGRGQQAPGV